MGGMVEACKLDIHDEERKKKLSFKTISQMSMIYYYAIPSKW